MLLQVLRTETAEGEVTTTMVAETSLLDAAAATADAASGDGSGGGDDGGPLSLAAGGSVAISVPVSELGPSISPTYAHVAIRTEEGGEEAAADEQVGGDAEDAFSVHFALRLVLETLQDREFTGKALQVEFVRRRFG